MSLESSASSRHAPALLVATSAVAVLAVRIFAAGLRRPFQWEGSR